MRQTNYHTHTKFCDGNDEPQNFVREAIKLGMSGLGFSSHAPLPFYADWVLKIEDVDKYIAIIESLKKEYKDKIEIFTGLEVDLSGGCIQPFASHYLNYKKLDYTIGSIHFFRSNLNQNHYTIDSTEEELLDGINYGFKGDIKKAVSSYYSDLREMIKNFKIDIVGHLDLIKKNNNTNKFFNESEDWYIKEINETLKIIAKSGCIVEINTGGINRKKISTIYPSEWILKKCFEKKIPITLNSDAHSPSELTGYFDEAVKIILKSGYKELQILTSTGWKPIKISQ